MQVPISDGNEQGWLRRRRLRDDSATSLIYVEFRMSLNTGTGPDTLLEKEILWAEPRSNCEMGCAYPRIWCLR